MSDKSVNPTIGGMKNNRGVPRVPIADTSNLSKMDKMRSQLYQSIDRAESDIANDRTTEACIAIKDIRSRYGL